MDSIFISQDWGRGESRRLTSFSLWTQHHMATSWDSMKSKFTTAGTKGDAFFSFLLLFLSCLLSFLGLFSDFLFLLSFFPLSSSWLLHLHHLPWGLFYFLVLFFPIMLLFFFRCRWLLFEIVSTHSFFLFYLLQSNVVWSEPDPKTKGWSQATTTRMLLAHYVAPWVVFLLRWECGVAGRMSSVNYGRTLHHRLPSRAMTTCHKAETWSTFPSGSSWDRRRVQSQGLFSKY